MTLHAFIAMPFGTKEGIDFDRVYAELIAPALTEIGFQPFRADEEMCAGEIRRDMFQELLLADVVIADLTIDNPNVWYELGVRHALRARGVVLLSARAGRMPFDLATDRVVRYGLAAGGPDPQRVVSDRARLAHCIRETVQSWHEVKVSPVYQLLPFLKEPDWKVLRVDGADEFWDRYDAWSQRIEIARRSNRPGDILVLAEETPTWVLRLEARRMAGKALMKLGQYPLALEHYQRALEIDPIDLDSRRQTAILLGRTGHHAQARECVKALLADHPHDAETWSMLGRVEKEEWIHRWRLPVATPADQRTRAANEGACLNQALAPYIQAFTLDPSHYYSAINALMLWRIAQHLGVTLDDEHALTGLEGGVVWACHAALARQPKDYWARVTLAEIDTLYGRTASAIAHYRRAIAIADHDGFALDSSRQQVQLLHELDFQPETVNAALEILNLELARLTPPFRPQRVYLFSGHMIDRPERAEPRFPNHPELIARAAAAIAAKLDNLGAGPQDLGICSGACGGDLLFAQACLDRGMPLQLYLPLREPQFLQASVAFAGDTWLDRYDHVKARADINIMPERLGSVPTDSSPYTRCNLWQLHTALAHGPDKVRVIALWNGKAGDGPGGTRHMIEEVQRHAGRAYVLNTTELWTVGIL